MASTGHGTASRPLGTKWCSFRLSMGSRPARPKIASTGSCWRTVTQWVDLRASRLTRMAPCSWPTTSAMLSGGSHRASRSDRRSRPELTALGHVLWPARKTYLRIMHRPSLLTTSSQDRQRASEPRASTEHEEIAYRHTLCRLGRMLHAGKSCSSGHRRSRRAPAPVATVRTRATGDATRSALTS